MTFQLPDYTYRALDSASFCAIILDDDIEHPTEEIFLETILADDSSPVWIRLIVNTQDNPTGIHVHVDTARESEFEEQPTANASLEELLEALERYRGCSLSVYPKARFSVVREDLPNDGVVSLLSSVVVGGRNEGMRLSGGTFSIDEGPITELRWRLVEVDEEERLVCTIESVEEVEIDDQYLSRPLGRLKAAFNTFVLENTGVER